MEFTNTFEGGLNKDSNILLQPRGTYRDMHNGMLVSYDGNHYVVELPKGTTVSFTIPPIYNGVYTALADIPTPIGFISFLDKLVVFSTNYKNTGTPYGEIGLVTFDKDGIGTYAPLYNHSELYFSIMHQITGFTYEENDGIKRVYWTDYNTQPKVLNTLDPYFEALSTGELSVGEEYMVVGGAITHNTKVYGPGLIDGNIFTAANANFTVTDGSPIVTKYINLQLLNWTPDRTNPEIDFAGTVPGNLNGGSKSYFVRLSTADGASSGWSYGTFPINVYNMPSFGSYNKVTGTGAGGIASANIGVSLSISGIDTYYDTIEVAAAEFDQGRNVLTQAVIFETKPVTGSTMIIDHTTETGTELTLNDLTIFPASIFKVKDMTTNKNYNIIGNITEREELTSSDVTTASISNLTYLMPADIDYGAMNAGIGKQPSTGVTSGNIIANGKYVVTSGSVTYAGNLYGPAEPLGPYFTGIAASSVYVGAGTVKACILIQKYKSQAGFKRYKHIALNDDYFDYRGMAATQYLRQYWSGETYRFAVVPYDKKGAPMYARWIGDHAIQSLSAKGGPIGGAPVTTLNLNGIRISGLTFSSEDIAKMSGFSIMRAPRDKQRFAQGIMFQTVGTASSTNASITPQPLNQLSLSADYTSVNGNLGNIMTWYSPDQLFGYTDVTLTANAYLEGECFIKPNSWAPYHNNGSNEGNTKFYAHDGSNAQSYKIERYDVLSPGGSINDYYSGLTFDNNLSELAGFPMPAGFPSGGKCVLGRTVALTLNGYPLFPGNIPMGRLDQYENTAKPLMNYYIPKSNLYGGQSPNALANTIYISTGHYQAINSTVLSDTFVAASGPDPDRHVFDEIDVWGGDSFLGIMSYGHSLYDNVQYSSSDSFSYGIFYPVESQCNHYLREGLNIEQYGMHNSADGVFYDKSGKSRLEQFGINDGYAADASIIAYPALPETPLRSNFPYRVRWAGPKTLGESTDSFRTFDQNNFRDLDGNKGQINNVRNRDGKVFFWQDHALGYLPILERVTVGGEVGEATQLGVGGVIDRFDTFNSYFGNQHKFGLIETEYGFTWFDFRRRAFMVMTVGGGVQEVSFVKGLQTFFNDRSLFYATQLTNSGYELQDNDTPLLGIGISGVYDPMYKMTYMNFKWVEGEDEMPTTWKEFTIGYHHPRNVFVGFFDIKGAIWQSHNNWLVAAKNINSFGIAINTSYYVGDTVKKNNVEYVCKADFATGNSIQGQYQPDFVYPNGDPNAYWIKTTQTNETSLLFSSTAFCKFFGYTYNSDIEFVINPKIGRPFTVDTFSQASNSINYDTVLCTVDDDSATESTNNKWYRYIDKMWQSTVPLGSKGRLVDKYLKVKFTLKNYTNNPTNSRNLQKLFEYVTSVLRIKK